MPWVIALACKLELAQQTFIPPHTDSKSSRKGFASLQKWKIIKPTINWYKSALPVPFPSVAASAQRTDHPLIV